MRWFLSHQEDGVSIQNISDSLNGFQIAGPKARDVLAACTRAETDLGFLDVRRMTVGMSDCIVQLVSYTGDLGYEIYCDPLAQRQLWTTLWDAGQAHGMVPFGMRAMMSLRLDRFFGSWLSEYSPDYTAAETGLDRFIAFGKDADFVGRAAAEAERANGAARKLVAFVVEADDADVHGYEPIWLDGAVQGFCTSGGYSHHAGKSVALGFLPTARIADGLAVEIEILGQMRPARVISTPLFDPDGTRLRG
jgi:dimethylglycine dehydrogenase